ncbi:hypothetical protein ACQEVB_27865 [Pseudonocardia sp. CA-107938]|uniref:hypothetical protein n=1 Tax=Pseudonocardia sp. CA-107938 TaxID=3240021 RepID=UPI003D91A8DD
MTDTGRGLPARANLGLQLVALVAAITLRAVRPGAVTEFLLVTVVGPLLALVPAVLAVAALRFRRLPAQLAVPFVVCAVALVAAAALAPDVADGVRWVPVFDLLGVHPQRIIRMDIVGRVLAAGYVLAVTWTTVAFLRMRRSTR